MDSNSHPNFQPQQLQLQHPQQQQQPNSGLLRFRSAPSSFLANFTEAVDSDINKSNPWEGSEPERLISRFVSNYSDNNDTASPCFQEFKNKSPKTPTGAALSRMNSQQAYSGLPPHYPRHNSTASSTMDSSYGLAVSMGLDHETQSKSFSSHLLRQSSSPAGLFSNIAFQNGDGAMEGIGNYGGVNGCSGEISTSMNILKNQISFSSRSASSLGMLSQISETGSESIGAASPDNGREAGSNGDTRYYGSGFPYASWNNTLLISNNLSGLKREQNNNEKLFSDAQNGELGDRVHILSHHLSLPKTSTEMAAMGKFLHFPDSVPCKIRAKRGCATHPRSIAERIRRTRISERMRKLQELVPNMDKQTSTAEMLDLAVEYIKDLQKQFKTLSEKRANCKCRSMQKADTDQIV